MKNIGIVAEYNPFHNGHLYHLEQTKKLTNSDNLICIMSGNFTQRGLPAICDKWERTQMALKSGIDLVIELPTYYAINSAEFFAGHSIHILNKLGIIDTISFGSEEKDIIKLKEIANILSNEPNEFKQLLKQELELGNSFAKSRENAIIKYMNNTKLSNILKSPNNILAIEYLKALNKIKSNISAINIVREKAEYNDSNITSNICSATAIRSVLDKPTISESDINLLRQVVPNSTFELMIKNIHSTYSNNLKSFEKEIFYLIRRMSADELKDILEVNEGLENTLKKYCYETDDIYELINLVKSKRFTESKIQRILLHILLDMTKTEFSDIQKNNIEYIRVLGFNQKGKKLLNEISKNTNIPIITSVKKYIDEYGTNKLLEKDILASNLYCKKNNIDYTHKIISID